MVEHTNTKYTFKPKLKRKYTHKNLYCFCDPPENCEPDLQNYSKCISNAGCYRSVTIESGIVVESYGCFKNNSDHLLMLCRIRRHHLVEVKCCNENHYCNKNLTMENTKPISKTPVDNPRQIFKEVNIETQSVKRTQENILNKRSIYDYFDTSTVKSNHIYGLFSNLFILLLAVTLCAFISVLIIILHKFYKRKMHFIRNQAKLKTTTQSSCKKIQNITKDSSKNYVQSNEKRNNVLGSLKLMHKKHELFNCATNETNSTGSMILTNSVKLKQDSYYATGNSDQFKKQSLSTQPLKPASEKVKFCEDQNLNLAHITSSTAAKQMQLAPYLKAKVHKRFSSNKRTRVLTESITSGSGSGFPFLVQQTISHQITLYKCIGQGRFGDVWQGTYEGEPVAVKIFSSRDEASWGRETEFYNQFALRHENILRYYSSDITSRNGCTQLWIVTAYHPLGSLYDYLQDHILDLKQTVLLAKSAAAGLCFIHTPIVGVHCKPCIAHRDIKSKNILVQMDGTCCIGDFDLAVAQSNNFQHNNLDHIRYEVGTKRYMAPELLREICEQVDKGFIPNEKCNKYSSLLIKEEMNDSNRSIPINQQLNFDLLKAGDVYAFALVLWELAQRCKIGKEEIGEPMIPYWNMVPSDPTFQMMYDLVYVRGTRPPIPTHWLTDPYLARYTKLMKECWQAIPENRLTMLRVKKTLNDLFSHVCTNDLKDVQQFHFYEANEATKDYTIGQQQSYGHVNE